MFVVLDGVAAFLWLRQKNVKTKNESGGREEDVGCGPS